MKLKALWISLITVFLALAAVYIAGAVFFDNFSFPHTSVTGIEEELGWMRKERISDVIEDALPDKMNVTFPAGNEMDIDLETFRDSEAIRSAGENIIDEQDNWKWPVEVLNSHDHTYLTPAFYDESRMRNEIDGYTSLYDSGDEAQDAYLEVDPDNHSYTIVEEIEGTKINRDIFADTVVNFVLNQKLFAGNLELDVQKDVYIPPEITSEDEDLNLSYNWLKAVAERKIKVDLDGVWEELTVGDFCDLELLLDQGELSINRDYVNTYVGWFSDAYDTLEKYRWFRNHKGEVIPVGGEGDDYSNYGYLLDREQTAELIYEALMYGESDEVTAQWFSKGQSHYLLEPDTGSSEGSSSEDENSQDYYNDIGNTYIEVSISEQHLWYYKDGKLFLDTDVVTGLPRDGRSTSRGVYSIFSEGQHVNLKGSMNGEDWDSWVDYWLSVTYSEIGIHDASWRNEFGGNIYMNNGSHGCINVPRPAMELLYNNAGIGTLVVIY